MERDTIDAAWYKLASEYHGGQWSSLYAFASSGTPTLGLASEVANARKIAEKFSPEDVAYLSEFEAWAEAWEERSSMLYLIDDGTLDTVLACPHCEREERYSELERGEDGTPTLEALREATAEHECEA